MIYDNNSIVLLFESGEFKFDTKKPLNSEKIDELNNKLKGEVDILSDISKDLNNPNISFGKKREKISKSINIMKKLAIGTLYSSFIGLIPMAISLILEKVIGVIISITSIIGIFIISSKFNKAANNLNKNLLDSYEKDINSALKILEDIDNIDLKDDMKDKVKSALEKVKNTIDEIEEYKNLLKNEEEIAANLSKEYDLENKFINAGEDVGSVGVVLKSSSDDEYTYIESIVYGYEDFSYYNNKLGLRKSKDNPNPEELIIVDCKCFSDDKWRNIVNLGDPGEKYIIIRCKKANKLPKKGQIFVQYV